MTSVSGAVDMLETRMNVPPAKAKAVARKLIDDGILPKSSGRRIELITVEQFVHLIFAALCSDKINDATRVATTLFNLQIVVRETNDEKSHLSNNVTNLTAGRWLALGIRHSIDLERKHGDDFDNSFNEYSIDGYIEICTSHNEVVFYRVGPMKDVDGFLLFRKDGNDYTKTDILQPRYIVKIPAVSLKLWAACWEAYLGGLKDGLPPEEFEAMTAAIETRPVT